MMASDPSDDGCIPDALYDIYDAPDYYAAMPCKLRLDPFRGEPVTVDIEGARDARGNMKGFVVQTAEGDIEAFTAMDRAFAFRGDDGQRSFSLTGAEVVR